MPFETRVTVSPCHHREALKKNLLARSESLTRCEPVESSSTPIQCARRVMHAVVHCFWVSTYGAGAIHCKGRQSSIICAASCANTGPNFTMPALAAYECSAQELVFSGL